MILYFKVSQLKFYVILFLILLIPISKKYRLLLFGIRTEGIAVGYGEGEARTSAPANFDYTLFQFHTEKGDFEIRGPENVMVELGEKARVIYNKRNPNMCMIFSFAYIYSTPNSLVPGFILILWIAFYSSFAKPETRHKHYP